MSNKNRLNVLRLPAEYVEKNGLLYPVEKGVMQVATPETDVDPAAPVSPTGKPVIPQWAVIALTVLVALAAAVPLIPGLPPVVAVIAGVVASIGAIFGIVSPGVRTQSKQ